MNRDPGRLTPAMRNKRYGSLTVAALDRLSKPFVQPLTCAAHPPAGCRCTWSYWPRLGGENTPFLLKFANRACPVTHARAEP